MQLSTHNHPLSRVRLSGGITPFSTYAFITCTGKNSPSLVIACYQICRSLKDILIDGCDVLIM